MCKPKERLLLVRSLWRRAQKTHSLRGSGCTGRYYGRRLLPGCRPGPGCCSWWTSPNLWGPPALWWWWCFASRPILRSKETEGWVQNLFRSNLWSTVMLSFSSRNKHWTFDISTLPPSGKSAQKTTRYPFSTPWSVILGGSAHVIAASSDVTEMARTFWGGWLGTENKHRKKTGALNMAEEETGGRMARWFLAWWWSLLLP